MKYHDRVYESEWRHYANKYTLGFVLSLLLEPIQLDESFPYFFCLMLLEDVVHFTHKCTTKSRGGAKIKMREDLFSLCGCL